MKTGRLSFLAVIFVVWQGCATTSFRPQAIEYPVSDERFLEQYAATYRFTAGHPQGIKLPRGGDAVLFLRSGPRDNRRDLFSFDPTTGKERVLVTASKLLGGQREELSAEEKARRERMRLAARGIATYDLSQDGTRLLIPLSGRLFVLERSTGNVQEIGKAKGYPLDARFSPDGKSVTCVRDGDLHVIDLASGQERKLTTRPNEHITFGAAEFIAQEEMSRFRGYWWSPDSQWLAYQKTDTSQLETMHITDPTDPSRPPQSWPYPRPGKSNAVVELGVIAATGGDTTWLQWDRQQYPYLARVFWQRDAPLVLLVQNREQTDMRLLRADPQTGATTELLQETDAAWLDLTPVALRFIDGGRRFLWMTERRGGWQLESRLADGTLDQELTPLALGLRELLHVDPDGGVAYVEASSEPNETHLARVSLNGSAPPLLLTEGAVEHSFVFGPGSPLYVQNAEALGQAPSTTVKRRTGETVGTLNRRGEAPQVTLNAELLTVGERDFRALVVRPEDFVAGRKYPVIVYVYGGPGVNVVGASPRRLWLNQWLANQGYIVVSVDGRGTPRRGRDWSRALRGSFVAVPLEDQVAGLQALGARLPELDLERVGIFGWSYGGYMAAMSVLKEPDVFHAGVAGAPVTEWLDYDTHYTERYVGLPQAEPDAYRSSSALPLADRLRRPLLLVHGTDDDNVYFSHSLKLSDALFRAGKHHELLALPGFTHMVADPLVTRQLYTRIAQFFARSLPPS